MIMHISSAIAVVLFSSVAMASMSEFSATPLSVSGATTPRPVGEVVPRGKDGGEDVSPNRLTKEALCQLNQQNPIDRAPKGPGTAASQGTRYSVGSVGTLGGTVAGLADFVQSFRGADPYQACINGLNYCKPPAKTASDSFIQEDLSRLDLLNDFAKSHKHELIVISHCIDLLGGARRKTLEHERVYKEGKIALANVLNVFCGVRYADKRYEFREPAGELLKRYFMSFLTQMRGSFNALAIDFVSSAYQIAEVSSSCLYVSENYQLTEDCKDFLSQMVNPSVGKTQDVSTSVVSLNTLNEGSQPASQAFQVSQSALIPEIDEAACKSLWTQVSSLNPPNNLGDVWIFLCLIDKDVSRLSRMSYLDMKNLWNQKTSPDFNTFYAWLKTDQEDVKAVRAWSQASLVKLVEVLNMDEKIAKARWVEYKKTLGFFKKIITGDSNPAARLWNLHKEQSIKSLKNSGMSNLI